MEGGSRLPDWDKLLRRKEYHWKEPHPSVSGLVQELKNRRTARILDLGCGAGRHTVYLSRLGFTVLGMDPALSGLACAAAWLRSEGLPTLLLRADMRAVPLKAGTLDCVISTYVLHHGTLAMIGMAFEEIRRLLVRGGILLALVQSKQDWKYGKGRRVEPDTFVPEAGDEAGVLHHFFDRRGIENLLGGFSIRRIAPENWYEELPDGRTIRHGHWDVLAEKE